LYNAPLDVTGNLTNLNSLSTTAGEVAGANLTINGDAAGDSVVFNFSNGVNLGGDVTLTGGLTPDMVLWNFVGNGNVQLNNNASSYPLPLAFQGIILAPNNAISLSNANLNGRVYGGDSSDMQIVGGYHDQSVIRDPCVLMDELAVLKLLAEGQFVVPSRTFLLTRTAGRSSPLVCTVSELARST
jgi:hypothetical protein